MTVRDFINKAPLEPIGKIEFALAYHGKKPASDFSYLGTQRDWSYEDETYVVPEGTEEKLYEDFHRLGIHGAAFERHSPQMFFFGKPQFFETLGVGIASNEGNLEELTTIHPIYRSHVPFPNLHGVNAPDEIERAYGKILGFPKTATEAYISGKGIGAKRIISDSQALGPEIAAYVTFMCSPANWRTEAESVREWSNFIKGNYPELHREIMKQFSQKVPL